MFILDLRWLLFAALAALAATFALGSLGRGLRRRTRKLAGLPGWAELGPGLEQAPCGFLLLEGERACRYANPYACRLLGLPAVGCKLPDATWASLLEADRAAVRREGAPPSRYRSVALASGAAQAEQDGPLVRWWVTPLDDMDLVFLLDVTGQQRTEEAARSLVNDISHELRTPLATILTHLEVLNLPGVSAETGRQSVDLLKAETRRMARLVQQMLELGRLETAAEIELRPVDLLPLAEEAVAQFAPQAAERRLELSLEADAPLPLCLGDADRLRQVFLNLLDNAVKYSRAGGRVVVSLARTAEGVRCAVRDNGPGIPVRHLPYLTRRFYRAAPQEVEGNGLGLALVAEILRRHGSRLEIESRTEGAEMGTVVGFGLQVSDGVRTA